MSMRSPTRIFEQRDVVDRVGRGRFVGVTEAGHRTPALAAQLVEAHVRCNAVHPGREPSASVEAGEPAHDRDERLLRGVSTVGVGARHAAAEREDAVVVPAQKRVHRGSIARLRGAHELAVVGHGRDARTVVMVSHCVR